MVSKGIEEMSSVKVGIDFNADWTLLICSSLPSHGQSEDVSVDRPQDDKKLSCVFQGSQPLC
jgi:hypothetical protein